jgi:hypothetical protein
MEETSTLQLLLLWPSKSLITLCCVEKLTIKILNDDILRGMSESVELLRNYLAKGFNVYGR